MTAKQKAEHQRDLDELARTKNARDQLAIDLANERRRHNAIKQTIHEYLAPLLAPITRDSNVGDIVRSAASALRSRESANARMSDDELKEELQRIDESDDGYEPLSFRDQAFLQSLAGSAMHVVNDQLADKASGLLHHVRPYIRAAVELSIQADQARDWEE